MISNILIIFPHSCGVIHQLRKKIHMLRSVWWWDRGNGTKSNYVMFLLWEPVRTKCINCVRSRPPLADPQDPNCSRMLSTRAMRKAGKRAIQTCPHHTRIAVGARLPTHSQIQSSARSQIIGSHARNIRVSVSRAHSHTDIYSYRRRHRHHRHRSSQTHDHACLRPRSTHL